MGARTALSACAFAVLWTAGALTGPASAADAEIKRHIERSNASYVEAFNRKDVAGVVAHYATGAIVVNSTGPKTDIPQLIEGLFKAGMDRLEATVDEAWVLSSDTALGTGMFRISGKSQKGVPLVAAGYWTVTYVQEDGQWKIRMSSIIPSPPPAR